MMIGLYVIPADWRALRAGTDAWLGPGAALVVVNGFVLIAASIPPLASRPSVVGPDIIRILALPWMTQEQLQNMTRGGEINQVVRLFMIRQYRVAFALGQSLLQKDPNDWGVRYLLTVVLQLTECNAAAADQDRVLRHSESLPTGKQGEALRANFSNNLAWSLYMLDDPTTLDEAEQAVKEALALNKSEPAYLGTYGSILVERGRVSEGVDLLNRALQKAPSAKSIASNYAVLAIASAREGDTRRAQRHLDETRRRDPRNPLIPRAERELNAATARQNSPTADSHVS
jgi:tetratricopeptide (TPR) repeat protein